MEMTLIHKQSMPDRFSPPTWPGYKAKYTVPMMIMPLIDMVPYSTIGCLTQITNDAAQSY